MTVAYLDPRTRRDLSDRDTDLVRPGPSPAAADRPAGHRAGRIDRDTRSLWRYRAALPLRVTAPISMARAARC
jgi:hypothetical protein